MNAPEVRLPDMRIIDAALRTTTERLAAELAHPTAQAPDWTDFEWRAAIAVSVMHGISALLAGRLRWAGPSHWEAFLAEQAEQGRLRELKVRELLDRLDHGARHMQLPVVALKGSAMLDLGLYAPGQRPQSDVDLLVRPDDVDATHRLVLEAGYTEGLFGPRHRAYQPREAMADPAFGEHVDNPIKIEVHTALSEALPVREVSITAQVFPQSPQPGLNPYPSLGALMRHLLLHAAGHVCGHGIRLIQLHDLWRLAAHLEAPDWDDALGVGSDGLPAWWAVPTLALTQRLFPAGWPRAAMARALGEARAACPPRLHRSAQRSGIDEVSLSRLRVPMLPGLAWSHSWAEALQHARRRLHPDREAMQWDRRAAASVHAVSGAAWTGRPAWQKALRFLLGPPPRVTTLYTLRRACAYEPTHSSSA